MTIRLDGQAAIITGAGAGIGRGTALLLAERGARVLVNDVDVDRAEETVAEIRSHGGDAVGEGSPVGTTQAARHIVAAAVEAFGRVDILVNNAGISRPAAFGDDTDDEVDLVLSVNLRGPYALMREVWPLMRAQGYGRILNTASSAALGSGISGAYAPSKAGIIGLTKEAAQSGRHFGIRVNAILPSAHTALLDKHPDPAFRAWMRANFDPRHVAAASLFLVSPDNEWTAELFFVGGGHISRAVFLESRGHFDRDLSPEAVRDNLARIMSLDDASPLFVQADHGAIYAQLFPRDGAESLAEDAPGQAR